MAQKIKFVTDSASDIPRSLREELDILVLPFPIAMGAREYQDGVDFTPAEFYDMLLATPHPHPCPADPLCVQPVF